MNVNEVVFRLIVSFVVSTKPWSPFVVPSSTNTNIPEVTSTLALASVDLAGVPPEATAT